MFLSKFVMSYKLAFVFATIVSFSVCIYSTTGLSPELAKAIQGEYNAYVSKMELHAADMHHLHQRSLADIREDRDRHRSRRDTPTYQITDLRHGFVPGSGVGNREITTIQDTSPIDSTLLNDGDVAEWEEFTIGRKQFLVASKPDLDVVEIYQFNASLEEPLTSVYTYSIKALAMTAFKQVYYSSGSSSEETKIVIASQEETIVLAASADGYSYQVSNLTVSPANVTDVKFFTIGIDSYLVFSQSPEDGAAGDSVKTSIYLWSATNQVFDIRQQLRTYHAQQVYFFDIAGKMYLLTVEKSNSSTVWKYNQRQGQFRSYQRLMTGGARTGLYFTVSYDSYIVMLNVEEDRSDLFHWDGFYFHETQQINTPSASSWAAIRDPVICQDQPILILSSELPWPHSLQSYNLSGSREGGQLLGMDLPGTELVPGEGITGVRSITQFSDWDEILYIALALNTEPVNDTRLPHTHFFSIDDEIVPVPSPYAVVVEETFEYVVQVITERLDEYETRVVDGTDRLRDAIKVDENGIQLGGGITFNGTIIFNGTVEVAYMNATGKTVDNRLESGQNLSEALAELAENVTHTVNKLNEYERKVNDRVTLNTTQSITGHKHIQSLSISGELEAATITATTIDGVNIEQLDSQALRNNVPGQTLTGSLTFDKDVTTDDVILPGSVTVNGFDMSNAVLEDNQQTIGGTKTFTNTIDITGNAVLQSSKTVDGVDISEQVVTLAGTHDISGDITFSDGIDVTGDITTTSTVDTIDVSELEAETVTELGGKTITGSVTFRDPVSVAGSVSLDGEANDIDLADMDVRIVLINEDTTITGPKIFSGNVAVDGKVIVEGLVDGVDLFMDSLLRNSSNGTTTSPTNALSQSFLPALLFPYGPSEGDTTLYRNDDGYSSLIPITPFPFFGQRHTGLYVNNNGVISFLRTVSSFTPTPFPLGDNRRLITPFWGDVDTRNTGRVYYRQVTRSPTNEPMFQEVDREVARIFRARFTSTWLFIATWHEVPYYGYNGPARNTFQAVLSTDGRSSYTMFNFGDIEWTTGTASGGSSSTGLGGTPAQVGFNSGDGIVYYSVPGSRTAAIVNIEETSNVNTPGRWLFQTNNVIIRAEASGQTITGFKHFFNSLTVDGVVDVTSTVDGLILPDDVVTLSQAHTITSFKTFADGINVIGDLHASRTIDGVTVSDLPTSVMRLSGTQTVTGTLQFNDAFEVEQNINAGGDINTVDIVALEAEAVYKNKETEQVITAAKTFAETVGVTDGDISFTGLVNTYDVPNDFLDLSNPQSVTGRKTFSEGLTAESNMTVGGTVDGGNIVQLWNNAALVSRSETLAGTKTFAGNLTVVTNLIVGDETNGIDLSEDVMMLNKPQTVTGIKQFGNVRATGAVQAASASINYLNSKIWSMFLGYRVTLSTPQRIFGDTVFDDEFTVNGNLDTEDNSQVNGVDLSSFKNTILYKTGAQTISGAKTFSDLVTFGMAATLDGTLDDVNIDVMTSKAIYLDDGAQAISGVKTFKNALDVQNNAVVNGLLNGVNLATLNADIVWTNNGAQTVTAKKVFADGFCTDQSIEVTNEVNGVDISEEVLTSTRAQDITGAYTFADDVTTDGKLIVDGLIDGVDIVALDGSAMKLDEDQTVDSHITFSNDMRVTGNIVVRDTETVDTIDLSELKDIARFVDEPFTLPNDVTFEEPVTFRAAVDATGTVHDVNLKTWSGNIITKNTEQTITGAHRITGTVKGDVDVVVATDIEADTAYGINLDSFFPDVVYLEGNYTITGTKTFEDDVTVEGSITVSNTVDGIDVGDNVVTLSDKQTITGSKTFTCSVRAADDVTISGTVNGIDISEEWGDTLDFRSPSKIEGTKTFIEDQSVGGDLVVDGLVNEVDITKGFTLNTKQTITGLLTFDSKATVNANIRVDGYVDTVNLSYIGQERITLSGSHVIEGTLTFNDMLFLYNNVTTEYLFDGVDLSELDALWHLRYGDYVERVYDLGCFAEEQCARTEVLAEVVNNFIDAIDYVEEIQVLPVHSLSFERFSVDGTTYLAAAVYANEHGDICANSVIYRWNTTIWEFEEAQQIQTNGAVAWLHFIINGEVFLIVANSGLVSCHDREPGNDIYKFANSTFNRVGSAGDIAATSDIAYFDINGDHFLVFTTSEGSIATVHSYNDKTGDFEVFQHISTGVTSSVEALQIYDDTYLIFSLYLVEISYVYIYNHSEQEFVFFEEIEAEHAREVTGFHYDNVHGFALADHISVTDIDASFEVKVRVFLWSDKTKQFELTYIVPVVQPGDVDIFSEGNFLYMSVVHEHHAVTLYRYEGSAGFVQFYEIPHHGARTVEIFVLEDDEYAASPDVNIDQHYIAVAVDPFSTEEIYSRVLKIINIGGSVQIETEENMCDLGLKHADRLNTPEPVC